MNRMKQAYYMQLSVVIRIDGTEQDCAEAYNAIVHTLRDRFKDQILGRVEFHCKNLQKIEKVNRK